MAARFAQTLARAVARPRAAMPMAIMPRQGSVQMWALQARMMSGGPTLSDDEKAQKILNILRCFDRIDHNKLSLDATFVKDMGLDSLDVVECVMAVEEEFAIELSESQAQSIRTPRDLLHYLH